MMKKKSQRISIPFSGLKLGKHSFDFEVDASFFEQFEYSIIEDASISISIEFEKKANLLELDFSFDGIYNTYCDRCNDPISIPLKGEANLIVKFGDESYDQTDEIKIIAPDEHTLDVTDEVYEFIHLMLPSKISHEDESDCNPKVIEALNRVNQREEQEEIDPRWAALEKLKQAHKNK